MIHRALHILILICGTTFAQVAFADPACRADTVLLRGDWGQARFSVEIADTPETRSKGLMFRERMRNTLISLDMIVADQRGVVQHVHLQAIPGDETTIDGGRGILAVLEINGGLAHAMGIVPGTQMRHPAFAGNTAAWPC